MAQWWAQRQRDMTSKKIRPGRPVSYTHLYMALTGSMTAFAGEQAKEEKGEIIRQKEERTTEKEAEEEKAEEKKAEEKKAEEKGTEEKDAEDKEAGKETGKSEEVVYIGIDNSHVFEGMKNSYAEGYVPEEKENKVKIVVPFTVDGELKNNFLTVGLDFDRAKDCLLYTSRCV